jgi:hypothetical protein
VVLAALAGSELELLLGVEGIAVHRKLLFRNRAARSARKKSCTGNADCSASHRADRNARTLRIKE